MRHERDDRLHVRPSAAFGHPLFGIALVVLVLNDHLLKGAGILPSFVTGKLSDVAGLLVAPAVLAWIVRAQTRERWLVAHAAVAVGFAALQLVPPLAPLLEALSPFTIRLWPDPTDLCALPAVAVSFVVFRRAAHVSRAAPIAGLLALLACTATSSTTPPSRYPFRTGGLIRADVFLRHMGGEDVTMQVLQLRDGVELDCEAIADVPERLLDSGSFGEERSWTLARGDAVPLFHREEDAPDRACYAVRVTMTGRTWLLAWRHGAPPLRDDVSIRLGPAERAEPDAVLVLEGEPLPRVPPGVTVRRL